MKQNRFLLAAVAARALVIGGAYFLYHHLSAQVSPDRLATRGETGSTSTLDGTSQSQSDTAPDFIAYGPDGAAVRLSDYFGKPIVLNLWASWCGYCKLEMPDFEAAYLEQGEDIHFLMLNVTDGVQETRESADAFLQEQGYTFPVLYDQDVEATMAYQAYGLPMTFFIDRQGRLAAYAQGAIDAQTLQQGIDMITG